MQTRIVTAFLVVLCLAACGEEKPVQAPKRGASPSELIPNEPMPLAQLPRVAIPERYDVTLTIDPAKERFSGRAAIDVNFKEPRRTLFIHGLEIRVTSAEARFDAGRSIRAKYGQVDKTGVARLIFEREVPKGRATLVFHYDAPFNTSLTGLYKVVDRGDNYAFTQFENTDARRAFPSFDEPGFKTPFDITVIAPAADKVVGNTPVKSTEQVAGGRTKTVFERTRPLPTYLIALAVGPLDIVDAGAVPPSKLRKDPIPIRGITARGNGPRIKYALSLTGAIVAALEDYYGIAYPFQKLDVLAVPDFAAGAMENAAAITYRERLLLDAEQSLETRRSSLLVQAHEIAHQWFGDYVTPAWWDDIWLNESFANWAEVRASVRVRPREEYGRETLHSSLDVMLLDEAASARQIHQPVHNQDDIDNAFDGITYDKGRAVLGMFESYVGEENWRRGIHEYLTKFAWKNATAQDFIGTIARVTNHPEIVAAFNSFIDQPGIPELGVDYSCEANEKIAAVNQSMYTQIGRTPLSRTWGVPMCLAGVGGGDKTCSLIGADLTQVNLKSQCTATLMPNSEGNGYYRLALPDTGWNDLIKQSRKLGPADQLTLFDNIEASFRAGKASATTYFEVLRTLAPVAKWDLLKKMQETLHRFRTQLLAPEDLPSYRALIAKLFLPRLKATGIGAKAGELPETALEREYLAMLVVEEARDPATMAKLAKAVAPYVASDGKTTGPIAPDVVPAALRAGVLVEGVAFADALTEAMETSNQENFRRSGIYALSGAEDKAALDKVLAWTARMRVGELRYLFQFMKEEPFARDALWAYLKANFAALEKRLSSQGFGRAPTILERACDTAEKDDLRAFFAPKTKDLQGTERPLAQTEEKIGYCIALKQAKGAEFASALQAAAM